MKFPVFNQSDRPISFGDGEIQPFSIGYVDARYAIELAKVQHIEGPYSVDLTEIAADLPFEDDDGRVHLSWVSSFAPVIGFGHFSCGICKYLIRHNDVAVHCLPYHNDYGPSWNGLVKPDKQIPAEVLTNIQGRHEPTRVSALARWPWSSEALASPYRIHVGFYETTNLNDMWIRATNGAFNEVWTFSQFCADLFASKVDVPVYRMRCGYDPEEYYPVDVPKDGPFRFGIAGRLNGRKGVGEVHDAFLKVFSGTKDVELHIKTRDIPLEGSGINLVDDPRIKYHEGNWPLEDMRTFYSGLDAFLFLSHGEGFGLEPVEAAACGALTLVTNWSGMADYAKEPYFIPIDPCGFESAEDYMICGGEWAKINFDDVADRMKWCYENRDECQRRGKLASEWVKTEWTIENGARDVRDRMFRLTTEL